MIGTLVVKGLISSVRITKIIKCKQKKQTIKISARKDPSSLCIIPNKFFDDQIILTYFIICNGATSEIMDTIYEA